MVLSSRCAVPPSLCRSLWLGDSDTNTVIATNNSSSALFQERARAGSSQRTVFFFRVGFYQQPCFPDEKITKLSIGQETAEDAPRVQLGLPEGPPKIDLLRNSTWPYMEMGPLKV